MSPAVAVGAGRFAPLVAHCFPTLRADWRGIGPADRDYCLGGISIMAMLCWTWRVQPESTAIVGTPAKGR
jgi:hypothetical protein